MGSLFRSEEMNLCQIFLQSEAAYACVSELGELGLVQFKDLNPDVNSFQRKFVNEILRCEEMERKLRYIEKELKKDGLKVPERGDNPKAPAPKEMIDLEATFEKMESELREVNTNAEALRRNFLELTELKEVLKKTQSFFAEHGAHHSIVDDATHALAGEESFVPVTAVQLGFVAGVIPREKVPAFERLLWFACRGNVFLRYDEILQPLEDPVTGDEIHKCVFIIFFQGEQLKARVRKICEGFKATLYPCPESPSERQEMLNGVSMRLEDLNMVLSQTEDHRKRVLASAQKEIRTWIIKVKKIKAIYHHLNMCNFDVSHNSLIAECWCPVSALEDVQMALRHGTDMSGSTVPSILHRMQTKETPPTFFRTNRFTQVFQSVVNAYGVATYQEVNPAPYTIITFPFLFAVMFGDLGHGFIMFLFGLWMVLSERKLLAQKTDNEIVNIFISGRYIIMMMGLFSIYTGLIYNDVFSKSLNMFGSSWEPNFDNSTLHENTNLQLNPYFTYHNETGPYPFGLDPVWQISTNKIGFLNTFKMKMSVILGICHMFLGVMLSFVNHSYFNNPLNIFCEFIPEVVFLLCLFGYLVALVFVKWVKYDWTCTQIAPLLLIQFIDMFLMKYDDVKVNNGNFTDYKYSCSDAYTVSKDDKGDMTANAQTIFYPNQQAAQTALVVLAVLMVPIMLLVKPLVLRARHNAKMRRKEGLTATSERNLINNEERPDQSDPNADGKKGESHLSEIELAALHTKDVTFSVNTAEDAAGEGTTHIENVEEDDEEEEEESAPSTEDDDSYSSDGSEEGEEFDFGEIFIHQAIHTIEYCLGCISHTASYLRLWALSLAHAQLSEVLWTMLFNFGLSLNLPYAGGIVIAGVFAAFAVLTVAVLLVMEGLSAFLHTLRLHWVEFQSKFYGGTGYSFTPYSFKHLLDASLDD